MPRNVVARKHGRGAATVTRIANERGVQLDRSATESATTARVADCRAARAALAQRFLAEADLILDQLHRPTVERKALVVSDGVRTGSHVEVVDIDRPEPTFAEQVRIMTAAAIAVDKSIATERHDTDGTDGVSDLQAFLRHLVGPEPATVVAP
jgi:hypothetical protein